MSETAHPILQLLREDTRYKLDAYQFVREGLSYAQDILGMGVGVDAGEALEEEDPAGAERHLTGQQLCEALRKYAVAQYGLMARTVLGSWGIHSTGDFGQIVYNLIRVEMMKKSDNDQLEDFYDVYDFETAFDEEFQFEVEEAE